MAPDGVLAPNLNAVETCGGGALRLPPSLHANCFHDFGITRSHSIRRGVRDVQCRPVVTRVSVLMIASDTVRYYGLFSPAGRPQLTQARALLTATIVTDAAHTAQSPSSLPAATAPATTTRCPFCQLGQLRLLAVLPRQRPHQAARQRSLKRKIPP